MYTSSKGRISNEEYTQGLIGITVVSIIIRVLISSSKKASNITKSTINNNNSSSNIEHSISKETTSSDILIPDICPHCKNPNSKKIRLCEWCGNHII